MHNMDNWSQFHVQIFNQQNAIFVPENDHQEFSSWYLLTESSWCLFTRLLPDHGFQSAEEMIVEYPALITGDHAIVKLNGSASLSSRSSWQQSTRLACCSGVSNFGTHGVRTIFKPQWSSTISWTLFFWITNSSVTRRTEICRSCITIRSTASMFSSVIVVDGRPIRGASSKPHSRSLNPGTHLEMVRCDAAESL